MIVYHASNIIITKPDVAHSRDALDGVFLFEDF